MPRSQEINQAIREERRADILAAAAVVFAHQGYVGTRISDIADAANMSHGLLYHYFASKEQVFTALVERAARGVMQLLGRAIELPVPPVERLRWLIEQELAGLGDDPHIFMVVLQAMMSEAVPASARQAAQELVAGTEELMRRLVTDGQAEGQIVAGDPREIATLLGTWLQGLAVGVAMRPMADSLPSAESLVRLFLPRGAS